jgi:hypothetical protein
MFTLKLFRQHAQSRTKMHKVMEFHRVAVMEIGKDGHALELQAFKTELSNDYETYYIGLPEEGMDAYGKEDLHLGLEPHSWWGWGLLENSAGKTTEHYRPASWTE